MYHVSTQSQSQIQFSNLFLSCSCLDLKSRNTSLLFLVRLLQLQNPVCKILLFRKGTFQPFLQFMSEIFTGFELNRELRIIRLQLFEQSLGQSLVLHCISKSLLEEVILPASQFHIISFLSCFL